MSLNDVLQTALEKIQYIAKTETVFGEPITAGEVTLIPVSKVSVGFAAGGAGSDKSKSGTGTGGGVQVNPVAFISITGDKVKIHTLSKSDPALTKILETAPELLKKVGSFLDKRKDKKEKSETAETAEK